MGNRKIDLYHFPQNARAERATKRLQALKVNEEACEVMEAMSDTDERIIEETWDVIHACEGLLRKFPRWKVRLGRARVEVKNGLRGDYAAGAEEPRR